MQKNRSSARSSLPRTVGALASAAVLAVGVSACGSGEDPSSQEPPATTQSAQTAAPTTTGSAPASSSEPASSPADPASSSASPTDGDSAQTAVALRAVETAQRDVPGSALFDLENDTDASRRVWQAKVAGADGRQLNLTLSQDGSRVLTNREDKTPDDDVAKLRSAQVSVAQAITDAATRAAGQGALTSLEIDTDNNNTVVWQINFGDENGTTVLVEAASGDVLAVGPDVG